MSILLSFISGSQVLVTPTRTPSFKNWFLVQSFPAMFPIFQLTLSVILFTTLSHSLPVHPAQNRAAPKSRNSLDHLEARLSSSISGSVHKRDPGATILINGSPTTLSDVDRSKYSPLKRQQVVATPGTTDPGAPTAAAPANPVATPGAMNTTDQTAGGTYQLLDMYKGKDFLNSECVFLVFDSAHWLRSM